MGNWICKREAKRIIIQGFDAAGKTSLLYRLKLGEVVTTIPTIGFNVETINVSGIQITCWDVGGRAKIRPLYRHYYQNTQGFVYVVDSDDRERLDDALDELVRCVLLEDETRNTVVMVLANKQDLAGAMSAEIIQKALEAKYKFSPDSAGGHTVFVRPCSVTSMDGVTEAFGEFVKQMRLKQAGKALIGLLPFDRSAGEETTKTDKTKQDEAGVNKDSVAISGIKTFLKDPVSYFKSLFY